MLYFPHNEGNTKMKKKLGGSVFIHNGIEFDYCLEASVSSLAALCDEVVLLDASSTDGTTDLCLQLAQRLPIKVITGVPWEQAPNHVRLPILANIAKSHLNTEWHFMLQADEVIHEDSFDTIRRVIHDPTKKSYFNRRLNFFGDFNHYIKLNQDGANKPCSDVIIRLATIENPAVGDAESLGVDPAFCSERYIDDIVIFHYGMVRQDEKHIQKILSMQSWFWGPGSNPDHRVQEMHKKGDGIFDWRTMKTLEMLEPLTRSHPKFAKEYVESRQALKKIPVN
jgi:hypothetical protein